MGEQFFDEFARGLDDGTMSRRRALKLLVSTLLGGGMLATFPNVSGAQEQQNRQHIWGGDGGHHFREDGQGLFLCRFPHLRRYLRGCHRHDRRRGGGGGGGRHRHNRRGGGGGGGGEDCPPRRSCGKKCCPAGEVCATGGGVCCPRESVCTVGGVPEACCPGTCTNGVCVPA